MTYFTQSSWWLWVADAYLLCQFPVYLSLNRAVLKKYCYMPYISVGWLGVILSRVALAGRLWRSWLACSCACGSGGRMCCRLNSSAHCVSHLLPGASGLAWAYTSNVSVRGTREQAETYKGSCMCPRFGQAQSPPDDPLGYRVEPRVMKYEKKSYLYLYQ